MTTHKIASREEWIEASQELLNEEKTWTRERDRLSEKRRALPWVVVDKNYVFEDADGSVTLSELFDGRSQLIVYHFMLGPKWEQGCPGCSFLADHVDGARQHFEHNDVSFVAVSRGPHARIDEYRCRMGWKFRWVSSAKSDFNFDFHVSFTDADRASGKVFHGFKWQPAPQTDEFPGISVFYKDEAGLIYHTYSSYGRGGEVVLAAYGFIDMVPKGRNERINGNLTDWVRRHDRYEDDGRTHSEPDNAVSDRR